MKTDHVIQLISSIRGRAYKFIVSELKKRKIFGLAPSHGATMSVLFEKKKLSMKELAERIDRDKSTVTALVKKLETLGYISRETDPDDNRISYITLTKKGTNLEPVFEEISEMMLSQTFDGFSQKDKESLVRGLENILINW